MRLYVTPNGRWAGTQTDAKALAREDASWQEEEVPTTKPELLAWLNARRVGSVAAHDANVRQAVAALLPIAPPPAPSYAVGSLAIDEAWQALPLARKLHLAALALEEARERLG